jgi:hypothetical protein
MKVLFLDIDGVLNNFKDRNFGEQLSPSSCQSLNKILEKVPDLKIVISSSWRLWGTDYMADLLDKNGVKDAKDKVIACTGNEQGIRGYQIQCWLDRHDEVKNFVILDDESDMGPLLTHLVKTNGFVGLTTADAARAIEVLSKPIK